jgi:hypothetical protein
VLVAAGYRRRHGAAEEAEHCVGGGEGEVELGLHHGEGERLHVPAGRLLGRRAEQGRLADPRSVPTTVLATRGSPRL